MHQVLLSPRRSFCCCRCRRATRKHIVDKALVQEPVAVPMDAGTTALASTMNKHPGATTVMCALLAQGEAVALVARWQRILDARNATRAVLVRTVVQLEPTILQEVVFLAQVAKRHLESGKEEPSRIVIVP